MLAVADCNNFFASCERSVDPRLKDVPIVVLSNNDGVIIARSNEAKALGIKMGEPFFKVREFCKKQRVRVFSGNFELYSRKSAEVMRVIAEYSPVMEVYSVDEAFMDISVIDGRGDLDAWGMQIRRAVMQATGIPLSVGIAKTPGQQNSWVN